MFGRTFSHHESYWEASYSTDSTQEKNLAVVLVSFSGVRGSPQVPTPAGHPAPLVAQDVYHRSETRHEKETHHLAPPVTQ